MMSISSYSQNTYPKKIVIEGDTIVALKIEQIKYINATFEVQSNLQDRLNVAEEYIKWVEEVQKNKDTLLIEYRAKISDLSTLNNEMNSLATEANKRSTELREQLKKSNRRVKTFAIISFVAGVVTVITLN